jgi:predicted HNH restriction endonuclease
MRNRSAKVVRDFKRAFADRGESACEACGWRPPSLLDADDLLHAHHVHPVCAGGHDGASNLVLLCPNHHALAHQLGRLWKEHGVWRYRGPIERRHLLESLTCMEVEPERFAQWYCTLGW